MQVKTTMIASGFGIDEDDLCPSVDAKITFLKTFLPTEYETMQTDYESDPLSENNTSDYLDYCDHWINNFEDNNGYTGFGSLFALAIQTNEDGFYPEYISRNGQGFIMYTERLPWEMTDRERNMDRCDMVDIFQKYLNPLNLSVPIKKQSIDMTDY